MCGQMRWRATQFGLPILVSQRQHRSLAEGKVIPMRRAVMPRQRRNGDDAGESVAY